MTAFHIRPYEHYCTEEILPLYEAVGWTNYTQRPDMLRDAFAELLSAISQRLGV